MQTSPLPFPEPLIEIRKRTSPEWIDKVLSQFDDFLVDHAACERKASATGINFVVQYPDRTEIIRPMIRFAREELQHFQEVCGIVLKRGIKLGPDEKDPYVSALMKEIRHGGDARFLDRLLVFGIVEARGTERFKILSENLSDPELQSFYSRLSSSEARHHELFLRLAEKYFSSDLIRSRLDELLEFESDLICHLPIRAAVH